MINNEVMIEFDAPKTIEIKNWFLCRNKGLKYVNFPELRKVGSYFLENNKKITSANFEKLVDVGDWFLNSASNLSNLNFPNFLKFKNRNILAALDPNDRLYFVNVCRINKVKSYLSNKINKILKIGNFKIREYEDKNKVYSKGSKR